MKPDHIYVAPPDYHLLIESDHTLNLWRGPKENNFRPAINPLFRSAAVVFNERVAGVILSGVLDDGVAGLWWIKRYGGVALVQDPEEAQFGDMPRSALEYVEVDHVGRITQLSNTLAQLATGADKEE
jgi:two-component system chemotaxis response regulator CheB